MNELKSVAAGIAVIILITAASITFGRAIYNATHQEAQAVVWSKTPEARVVVGETWKGVCYDRPWWIEPLSSNGDGYSAIVLEGNPFERLMPVEHEVPGSFISRCVKVQAVREKDEGSFVFRIYAAR